MTTYTLLGWSDIDTCECCGRRDLERTARLRDEDGYVLYLGSHCAARRLGARSPHHLAARVSEAHTLDEQFADLYWANARIEQARAEGDARALEILTAQREQARAGWDASDRTPQALHWWTISPARRQAANAERLKRGLPALTT